MEAAYDLLEQGLAKQIEYPLVSFDSEATVAGMVELRSLARASTGRGRLSSREGDFTRAANVHLQTVEFGHRIRKKGLIIHHLVGVACSGMGRVGLYEVKDALPPARCLDIASEILQLELDGEPIDLLVRRDEAWVQRTYGWHGHLHQIMEKIVGEDSKDLLKDTFSRELATMRLLRTEFALVAFQKENGKLPQKLTQLIPRYLSEIPADPFSVASEPFKYRIDGESYVLYSLGSDRDDDGGVLPEDYVDMASSWGTWNDGDLRLEYRFSPEPDGYFEESDP